jgi:HK97 family phage major capsid protein
MQLRVAHPQPLRLHSRGLPIRGNAAVAAGVTTPSLVEVTALLTNLNTAVAEMRTKHAELIAAQARGRDDVIAREQVERIGTDVTTLQATVSQLSADLAAARMGSIGGKLKKSKDIEAHALAFDGWFRHAQDPGAKAMRQLEIAAALSTDSNPDGGYVVPEEVETEITRVLGTVSVLRRLARVRTISTGNYKKPHNLAGTGYGWVGEKDSRPETATPTLSELDFPAMELYAQPGATQNLLDDARIAIGAWLGEEVQITFGEQEGAAFATGDGNKKPMGLIGTFYTKVLNSAYVWGKLGYIKTGVAANITDGTHNGVDQLKALIFGLKSGYTPGATFVMNRNTLFAISILKDLNGNYLWQPSNQVDEPSVLLGYPTEQDDNFPDIGANTFPVAFGNFLRGYLIVDRAGITVLRDPYTKKPYVLFYTTKRVGGGVQDFDAIKLLKCEA